MKPDFYIVGAPKSGTTAFDYYLSRHPDVYMIPKEMHYWGSDLIYESNRTSIEEYNKVLSNKKGLNNVIGEGAVWYLVSENAAKELKNFTPDAKIIIFLRNPIDACYSLYFNTYFNGNEILPTFEAALEAQKERLSTVHSNYNCPTITFQYQAVFEYYVQVKRYIEIFGIENIKIVLYDDISKNIKQSYSEILEFLNLKPYHIEFKRINESRVVKSRFIKNVVKSPSRLLKVLSKIFFPSQNIRNKIKSSLWRMNTRYIKRPEMNPETRKMLQEYYKEDIERLSKLINKDLTSLWK